MLTISRVIHRILQKMVGGLSLPIILAEYFRSSTGKDYGVGFRTKTRLLLKVRKNTRRITTASHFLEHMIMATQILKVSPSIEGCVVECGSFKGGSTANLSLVCSLCRRDLEVFDSFEGLPEPAAADRTHVLVGVQEIHTYEKGAWRGSLAEVKSNVSRFGDLAVCNFNVGYFEQTLPQFHKRCVLAFLDVDLTESLRTCLKYLWPLLRGGCCVFTHEAHHMEVAALFFDPPWWRQNLDCAAPGLIGAGTGLGLQPGTGGFHSALGYTVKNPEVLEFVVNPQTGESDP
jgi:hypothetical protein